MSDRIRRMLYEVICVLIGNLIVSFGVTFFILPSNILSGGTAGISAEKRGERALYPSGGDVFKVVETGERGDYHIYGQRKDAGLSASCHRGDFKESAGAGGLYLSDEGTGKRPVPRDPAIH